MRDDDQRDAERIAILGELPGEIMIFEPMLVRDISHGGVTIETRFPLQLNSLHDIRLMLGGRPIIVKGRVVHSRISDVDQEVVTYRSGIEFVEPPERISTAIEQFVETVKTDRTGV